MEMIDQFKEWAATQHPDNPINNGSLHNGATLDDATEMDSFGLCAVGDFTASLGLSRYEACRIACGLNPETYAEYDKDFELAADPAGWFREVFDGLNNSRFDTYADLHLALGVEYVQ